MASTKIQVAIQGGGARFVHLLAAAHPFSELHKGGNLQITQVAGTSAGSIVAALLAVNADFSKANAFLKRAGAVYARKLIGRQFRFVPKKIRRFPSLLKAYYGWSILDEKLLRKFLTELFKESAGNVPPTIGDAEQIAKIGLKITTSDIRNNTGHIFTSDENFIEAIASSCALPFAFRNYRTWPANVYVDGGLCDNLPAELLLSQLGECGDVFAVSPDNLPLPDRKISSLDEYLIELFSSSINHNVLRSRSLVGEFMTIGFKSELATLDFVESLGHLKGSRSYDAIYTSSLEKIGNYIRLKTIGDQPKAAFNAGRHDPEDLMSAVDRVYQQFSKFQTYRITSTTLTIHGYSLDWTQRSRRMSDVAHQETRIQIFKEPVFCVGISLLAQENSPFLKPMRWQVRKAGDKSIIEAELVPMRAPQGGPGCAIFFQEALQSDNPGGEEYVIEYVFDAGIAMTGIDGPEKHDFIGFLNRQAETIAEVNLILSVPKTSGADLDVRTASGMDPGGRPWPQLSKKLSAEEILTKFPGLDSITERVYGAAFAEVGPGVRIRAEFFRGTT